MLTEIFKKLKPVNYQKEVEEMLGIGPTHCLVKDLKTLTLCGIESFESVKCEKIYDYEKITCKKCLDKAHANFSIPTFLYLFLSSTLED